MLPKKHRLTNPELVKVKRRGKVSEGGVVSFLVLAVPGSVAKFGFVVSTRVSKKATERNRIKRKLREVVRQLLPQVKEGYHVVVLARRTVLAAKMGKLTGGLARAMKKAGLMAT